MTNRLNLMLAAGALALAVGSVAIAQQNGDPSQTSQPAAAPATPPAPDPTMQPAAAAGANASATVGAVSPDTTGQVQAVNQGDNTLVTNGPVPDTAANRAKYGGPMSMTGKKTKPAGN